MYEIAECFQLNCFDCKLSIMKAFASQWASNVHTLVCLYKEEAYIGKAKCIHRSVLQQ